MTETIAGVYCHSEKPEFLPQNRRWQGIASIEGTRGGGLYACFYSGMVDEQPGNFVVVIRSADGGKTWRDPELAVAVDDPAYRCFDPNLWLDPQGRLWLSWAQRKGFVAGLDGVWVSVCDDPDARAAQWSAPRCIANGVMMNKPTVLKCGTWLFPCAVWSVRGPQTPSQEMKAEMRSNVYASEDQGAHFTLLGGAEVPDRSFDEHMVVELRDGRLWMLVRTAYGIGQSFSGDGGRTWSAGEDSGLGGPCSRFFIRRLRSGNLLLVNHRHFTGRNNLTAMLSRDDGRTWSDGLLLDERDSVSYPDGFEDDRGCIYIAYDRKRQTEREVLMAVFTQEDVLAGRCVSRYAALKQVISRAAGPGPESPWAGR